MTRVYHFLNQKYGLEDLQRRRLKISIINELNDPFELLGPSTKDSVFRRSFLDWKSRMSQHCGILCFSLGRRNPVQWSHYADGHRGICLGFDVQNEASLLRVRYQQRRLTINSEIFSGSDESCLDEPLKEVLSTKFSHWRYEQEARMFVGLSDRDREAGHFFFRFSEGIVLKEVIVGALSEISRDEISLALGDLVPEIDIFRARLAFRSFDVVKQLDRRLW
ncbi:DUF2971 domain-containing protein [Parvibaculum sedimenti]|uniref:DUF2971 domain-containing protein n=1 Tax=Parvibaculum sedimenti TaxID=2608632 RepID=A0A6N6VF64_9HYPH|nr:DUF2971 domain-containing protein [Parvibaculum sedimenti]KAB7739419.1 DUF2971 domain-containing protein [Parvibaculum sedimenti]